MVGVVTYGLLPALFLSAILARKFGGATIFAIGLFIESIVCLLMPAFLLTNFWLLAVLRIIQGIGEVKILS